MCYILQIIDTNYILKNMVIWEICSTKSFLVFPFAVEDLLLRDKNMSLVKWLWQAIIKDWPQA